MWPIYFPRRMKDKFPTQFTISCETDHFRPLDNNLLCITHQYPHQLPSPTYIWAAPVSSCYSCHPWDAVSQSTCLYLRETTPSGRVSSTRLCTVWGTRRSPERSCWRPASRRVGWCKYRRSQRIRCAVSGRGGCRGRRGLGGCWSVGKMSFYLWLSIWEHTRLKFWWKWKHYF